MYVRVCGYLYMGVCVAVREPGCPCSWHAFPQQARVLPPPFPPPGTLTQPHTYTHLCPSHPPTVCGWRVGVCACVRAPIHVCVCVCVCEPGCPYSWRAFPQQARVLPPPFLPPGTLTQPHTYTHVCPTQHKHTRTHETPTHPHTTHTRRQEYGQ